MTTPARSATASPKFRRTLTAMREKKVIVPILRTLAADVNMRSFSVEVEGPTKRPWDGWFHPSSQATWTARQLYYYLTAHEVLESEEMEISSVFAISQGHFLHALVQGLLLSNGTLVSAEEALCDSHHNRRGHMVGRLARGEGFEIKTINQYTIKKIEDGASLQEEKPEYYAQAQDYLDMSGLPAMRFFFIQVDFPFEMTEVLVQANEKYQAAQRAKYRTAIEAAEEGEPPEVCDGCGFGSDMIKTCPVARACPIATRRSR